MLNEIEAQNLIAAKNPKRYKRKKASRVPAIDGSDHVILRRAFPMFFVVLQNGACHVWRTHTIADVRPLQTRYIVRVVSVSLKA
jgi:hypothetical protein